MTDEVDLGEVTDEPSNPEPIRDLLLRQAELPELAMCNRPMLNGSQGGDPEVEVVSW